MGSSFRERAEELRGLVVAAYDRDSDDADQLFGRRIVNLQRICGDLSQLASTALAGDVRKNTLLLRRHLSTVRELLNDTQADAHREHRALEEASTGSESDEEKRLRLNQLELIRLRVGALQRLDEPLSDIGEFVEGAEGQLLTRSSSVLLLGEWGTGKTHFLCDFALQALRDETPVVVVLASELRTDVHPLDAIAEATKLAESGADLVSALDAEAARRSRRALLLIDAINESDRGAWRKWLPRLVSDVARVPNLGLVVTCRTPFDVSAVVDSARARMVELHHPGFEDQEFDAQLEFFQYYDLPPLHVPLLSSEFSRPLFLRLMCEGVKDLSKRSQKDKLRDLASGQKSMTYVLENFVKHVGAEVEAEHGLSTKACWYIMKGEPRQGRLGLAGVLATNRREWLTADEVAGEIQAFAPFKGRSAQAIMKSMLAAGLLIETSRYGDGGYIDVYALPYQRFSDHLVARHLLDEHLDASTEAKLRRCFYANRRLGAVFVSDRWGRDFSEPGVASALMIEFPERIKRLNEKEGSRTELLSYLPKERRLLHPFVDAFLEGLYWRPASSLTPETERLVALLADRPESEIRTRSYEVVTGLAARGDNRVGFDWLHGRLRAMTMPERDLHWSEFLRKLNEDSNIHRLLAWVEREDLAHVDPSTATRASQVLALILTTTDRRLRDRATRALVLVGECHPAVLFDLTIKFIGFNDPYVPERMLAAAYGACLRCWALEKGNATFADLLATFGRGLLETVLRADAPYATWHALARGYAIGILRILLQLRPRALAGSDRELLVFGDGHAPSPFRPASRIRKADVEDPEHAINMDFGNYTIGRLVDGRGNYDFKHPEYGRVRRQIADRMRRLGYSTERFNVADRAIVNRNGRRREGEEVDRYGKKYSWIAFYEMYGFRAGLGKIADHRLAYPWPSDADIDPSFPQPTPTWKPPHRDAFEASPVAFEEWLTDGEDPDYASLLRLTEVDGNVDDWVLLDAHIHEGAPDGRELKGWVTSVFAPDSSLQRLREEIAEGRELHNDGFPNPGADYYTFHGEVPWSPAFGSDVRRKGGRPRRLNDRAFTYFDSGWKPGIPVEQSSRHWAWESYHSQMNQTGNVMFPAPPIATDLGLRVVGGSSDMVDERGALATIYRKAPGPGYGCSLLYIRGDLVRAYSERRSLHLVQAVVGERTLSYRVTERRLSDPLRRIFQSGVHRFSTVSGLDVSPEFALSTLDPARRELLRNGANKRTLT
ncbi:NACHT domain-containing protein [Mycolicibacterium frederiksbergense]|uniref:NACHT domain-containing protein n=1 Tax=Mycolicibacterium frederiksbergense TaxID=117567 RepID=UPI002474428A|nr:NACHT domain-containing protein [Mycolicibacterium frederiksbergense]